MNHKTQQSAAILIALVIGLHLMTSVVSAENIFVDRYTDSNTATACQLYTANDCSLRGAIIRANGNGEDDTIWIPMEGTYTLTLDGSGDTLGDLDITDNLIIEGWNRHTVIIDTSGIPGGDRAFSVNPGVTATIRDVWITDLGIDSIDGSGGGIWNGGTLTLERVRISSISTLSMGGGIFNGSMGWLELQYCTVIGNDASVTGGGIFNEGELRAYDSTIRQNIAFGDGGGIFNDADGDVLLVRSSLRSNISYDEGGGAYNEGSINAVNTTFTGNAANHVAGGAIFNAADLDLTNVTFVYNESLSGTAIYNAAFSYLDVVNTIVDGTCVTTMAWITSLGGNIERLGDTCGFNHASDQHVTVDMFSGGSYSGGLTLYFPIQPGSPAIDAGSDLLCPDEDQRGRPRPIDADPGLYHDCDSGAHEYNPEEIFLDGFEFGNTNSWASST